jgi:RNA polymerase sigma factor (sigma-70 family)
MNTAINTTIITAVNPFNITAETTLGEVLAMLNLGDKPHDTPTPKTLRETAGDPIALFSDPIGMGEGGTLYANGYAVWDNGSGRTVIWGPDCASFTYYFVNPKESEIGIVPEKSSLPDDLLKSQPWTIDVALLGEHRIEQNSMNRTGSRTGTKDYDSADYGDKDGDAEVAVEQSYRSEYTWREGRFGENPEDAYIRKETQKEMLEAMTDKQREVFVLYYGRGYTQQQIADKLGISKQSVNERLYWALECAKKI